MGGCWRAIPAVGVPGEESMGKKRGREVTIKGKRLDFKNSMHALTQQSCGSPVEGRGYPGPGRGEVTSGAGDSTVLTTVPAFQLSSARLCSFSTCFCMF